MVALTLFRLNEISLQICPIYCAFLFVELTPMEKNHDILQEFLAIKWALMKCWKIFEKPHCFI